MGRYNEALEELRRTDELAHGFFLVQTEAYMCEQFLSGVIDAEAASAVTAVEGQRGIAQRTGYRNQVALANRQSSQGD